MHVEAFRMYVSCTREMFKQVAYILYNCCAGTCALLLGSCSQSGMLESFPKEGSEGSVWVVDFNKQFWEKLPMRMCQTRDLARKSPMEVVLLKLAGGEHYKIYTVHCPRFKEREREREQNQKEKLLLI